MLQTSFRMLVHISWKDKWNKWKLLTTAKILLHSLKTAKERTLRDLGLKHTQTILKGGKHRGQAKTAVTFEKPLLIYSLTLHVLPSLHFLFKLNFCSLYVLRELVLHLRSFLQFTFLVVQREDRGKEKAH